MLGDVADCARRSGGAPAPVRSMPIQRGSRPRIRRQLSAFACRPEPKPKDGPSAGVTMVTTRSRHWRPGGAYRNRFGHDHGESYLARQVAHRSAVKSLAAPPRAGIRTVIFCHTAQRGAISRASTAEAFPPGSEVVPVSSMKEVCHARSNRNLPQCRPTVFGPANPGMNSAWLCQDELAGTCAFSWRPRWSANAGR